MAFEKIRDMIAFATPLRVIARPERLIIRDYRPTALMLLAGVGFIVFSGILALLLWKFGLGMEGIGLWGTLFFALACLAVVFHGTIWEVYVFDRATQSYAFVRQFIHRKEIIEGALSQFTGARVETHVGEESESYTVVLRQEGMFLTGATEQTLREVIPLMNSFSNEAEIANAIDDFLHRKS